MKCYVLASLMGSALGVLISGMVAIEAEAFASSGSKSAHLTHAERSQIVGGQGCATCFDLCGAAGCFSCGLSQGAGSICGSDLGSSGSAYTCASGGEGCLLSGVSTTCRGRVCRCTGAGNCNADIQDDDHSGDDHCL